jgi:hypothetical protein
MGKKTDDKKSKRVRGLESALRIIHIWALCDEMSPANRKQAMENIADKCRSVLKSDRDS